MHIAIAAIKHTCTEIQCVRFLDGAVLLGVWVLKQGGTSAAAVQAPYKCTTSTRSQTHMCNASAPAHTLKHACMCNSSFIYVYAAQR